MTDSDEAARWVREIAARLNNHVTEILELIEEVQHIGTELRAFDSHNLDIAVVAGNLLGDTPQRYRELITQYKVHVASLEHYASGVL